MAVQVHKDTVTIAMKTLNYLSMIADLKAKEYKVALFLMTHIDSRVPKSIDTAQGANALMMEEKKFIKCLEALVLAGVLVKENSDHVKGGYRFDML